MTKQKKSAKATAWPWPDSLDALVAAPDYHKLLLENEHVRVLRVCIGPGRTVPVHTHRWPAVMNLESWSDFIRRDEEGKVTFDSRTAGPPPTVPGPVWSEALPPHSVENVGGGEIRILSIELKD